MSKNESVPIDSVEALEAAIARIREAQRVFSTYTQEQVDRIFAAAASAANKARLPLAKQAVAETGMGVVEDKVIKNNYAAEYIYNAYKDTRTCGVIERDPAFGITRVAEPLGPCVAYTYSPLKASAYIACASAICFRLLMHRVSFAFSRAFASAGSSIDARIAMIAITTSSSISVKQRTSLVRMTFPPSKKHVGDSKDDTVLL